MLREGLLRESGRGLGEIARNAAESLARENALCGGEVRGWHLLGSWVLGRRGGGGLEGWKTRVPEEDELGTSSPRS